MLFRSPAECLIKIETIEQLKSILKYAKNTNEKLTIFGNGSNILVSDEGVKGITIKINIKKLEIDKENAILKIGSGEKLGMIARKMLKRRISRF